MKVILLIQCSLCIFSCLVDECEKCDPHALCVSGHCKCRTGYIGNGYECVKGRDIDSLPEKGFPLIQNCTYLLSSTRLTHTVNI